MGAMNRHPSCNKTWRQTTLASKHISDAHAKLLLANSRLEDVLLAEFPSTVNISAVDEMITLLQESADCFVQAQAMIRLSIDTANKNPDDFVEARDRLNPVSLATDWSTVFDFSEADIVRVAGQVKSDRLATAKQFVDDLDDLQEHFPAVIDAFTQARSAALDGRLEEKLEKNLIPLQRDFGILYSKVLTFMRGYLTDSLVATQVSFDQRNYPALAVAS